DEAEPFLRAGRQGDPAGQAHHPAAWACATPEQWPVGTAPVGRGDAEGPAPAEPPAGAVSWKYKDGRPWPLGAGTRPNLPSIPIMLAGRPVAAAGAAAATAATAAAASATR